VVETATNATKPTTTKASVLRFMNRDGRVFREIGFPGLSGKCKYHSDGTIFRLKRYQILTIILAVFSTAETILAIESVGVTSGPAQTSPGGPLSFFWQYSIPFSIFGWAFVSLSIVGGQRHRKSQLKSLFAKRGFSGEVYDLMIGMRGGNSRLALLRGMQEPRHRQELADITGIDWKEVDRQITVLERYGLVKMYAQSGTVQVYHITEQGKLLLNLITDLQSPRPQW